MIGVGQAVLAEIKLAAIPDPVQGEWKRVWGSATGDLKAHSKPKLVSFGPHPSFDNIENGLIVWFGIDGLWDTWLERATEKVMSEAEPGISDDTVTEQVAVLLEQYRDASVQGVVDAARGTALGGEYGYSTEGPDDEILVIALSWGGTSVNGTLKDN